MVVELLQERWLVGFNIHSGDVAFEAFDVGIDTLPSRMKCKFSKGVYFT
jgi:hypothetical protein